MAPCSQRVPVNAPGMAASWDGRSRVVKAPFRHPQPQRRLAPFEAGAGVVAGPRFLPLVSPPCGLALR